MIREHFEAVRALVDDVGVAVYDTDAGPSPTPPYVVIWGGDFRPYGVSVCDSLSEVAGTVGVTCTAATAAAARSLQSTVQARLTGASVTVDGRHAFPLVLEDVRPVQVDREVKVPDSLGGASFLFYGVLIFRLESTEDT